MMVEEKKKRGRPKKIKEGVILGVPVMKESGIASMPDQKYRRDDLVVAMIMAVLNKQGNIKWDFALDLFKTGTNLAQEFGWMEKPKEKKLTAALTPDLPADWGTVTDAVGSVAPVSPLANTPADIFRQIRGES